MLAFQVACIICHSSRHIERGWRKQSSVVDETFHQRAQRRRRRASLRSSLHGLLLKVLLQALPALVVLMLELSGLHRELRGLADEARFEHEGQRVAEVLRLQFGLARALE